MRYDSTPKIESLKGQITAQIQLYKEASDRYDVFSVKEQIFSKIQEIEHEITDLQEGRIKEI